MSTRSIIMVTGITLYNQPRTIRLYKHSDGYPTGNLPLIFEALNKGQKQVGKFNERFKDSKNLVVDQITGLIIGEASDVYGMGAKIDSEDGDQAVYPEKIKPEHLGNQGDLEWIYVVDLDVRTLNIYGGRYTGELPQVAYGKGVVDPLTYCDHLKPDYVQPEIDATKEVVSEIEKLGFKVNHVAKKRAKK